jgi:GTP-binding protein
MLECCWDIHIPAHVLLTKSDKFKRGKAMNVFQSVQRELKSKPLTTVQLFSAQTKQGVDEASDALREFLTSDELEME